LDPIVILYDESGKRIAYQDDPTTNSAKEPANVDPHLVFELPKAGRYIVRVRDNAYRGDPNYPYRLVLKPVEPDFQAGVVGTDHTLFRGRENIVTLQVRRLEGWDTPIELWAENLPPGVTAPEKVVASTEPSRFKGTCGEEHILDGTKVDFPMLVAADAPLGLTSIKFRARGMAAGRVVEHEVMPRYWFRSRRKIFGFSQTQELYTTVADLPELVLEVPDRISVPANGEETVQIIISRFDEGTAPLELKAAALPEGLSIDPVTVRPGATLADLKVAASGKGPFTVVLEGSSDGKVLGQSHPIAVQIGGPRSARQVASDDE
jgi:hypothetical protein